MRNAELQGIRDDINLALLGARENPVDPGLVKQNQIEHDLYWSMRCLPLLTSTDGAKLPRVSSSLPTNSVTTTSPMLYPELVDSARRAAHYLNTGGKLDRVRGVLDDMTIYPQRYPYPSSSHYLRTVQKTSRHELLHNVAVKSADPNNRTRFGINFQYYQRYYSATGFIFFSNPLPLDQYLDMITNPLEVGSSSDEVFYGIATSMFGRVFDRESWQQEPSIKRIRRQKNQSAPSTINIDAPTWEQIQTGAAWGELFPHPLRPESA